MHADRLGMRIWTKKKKEKEREKRENRAKPHRDYHF